MSDAFNQVIEDGDTLLVSFGNESAGQIDQQLESIQ